MDQDLAQRPVLAVYDFRSKQEFIYRTNRMREITGASELIAGMYERFANTPVPSGTVVVAGEECQAQGGKLVDDWTGEDGQPRPLFQGNVPDIRDGEVGIVVYAGGGNLLVLYRNEVEYIQANRAFSRLVLDEAYTLQMISACAPWKPGAGEEAFREVRDAAFAALDRQKRSGACGVPTNVLPYTLQDRVTFQPLCAREGTGKEMRELSREAELKTRAFDEKVAQDNKEVQRRRETGETELVSFEECGKFIDELGTERGKDSLIAVLYFDGNSIGERVQSHLRDARPNEYIEKTRDFSKELHKTLVENTLAAIDEAIGIRRSDLGGSEPGDSNEAAPGRLMSTQRGYRVIIDHGDEITLVCNAHAAPLALDAYFGSLADSGYHACGGVAFCHAHAPFSEVYRIAEECCESGKKMNRKVQAKAMSGLEGESARAAAGKADASYVDFHFVRAGITGSLDAIREAQEAGLTARPYRVGGSYDAFVEVGCALADSKISRSDLKGLNRAILAGQSRYLLELERLRAKDPRAIDRVERAVSCLEEGDEELLKKVLFDVTSVCDVFDVRFRSDVLDGGDAR